MQRVASMSVVVKANGISEAWYNGQRDRVVEAVRAEASERIRQAKREVEIERRRADDQTRAANLLRKHNLNVIADDWIRKPRFLQRIEIAWAMTYSIPLLIAKRACSIASNALLYTWAYIWAYTFGGAWIDVLITLKLIERIEE